MWNDFSGKVVVITGGTRGIGLATALAFGRLGAHCIITHRWGTADEGEILSRFASVNAPEPLIVEADVAREEDTLELLRAIHARHDTIDVFVSNVAFGQLTAGPTSYTKRGLFASIEYTAWPIVSYSQAMLNEFGRLPNYIVGISSSGPNRYIPGYDLVASAKAVLETLAKYLAHHYGQSGTRVNILRAGKVHTDSLEATIGAERVANTLAKAPHAFMQPSEIANAVVALCSGWMDGVAGQVIDVDRGVPFDSDRYI